MMADLAWHYHWQPSEMYAMTGRQLARWHDGLRQQVEQINKS